jgi:hypothetical protein
MFADQFSNFRDRLPSSQLPQSLQPSTVLCVLFAQIPSLQSGFVFLPLYLQTLCHHLSSLPMFADIILRSLNAQLVLHPREAGESGHRRMYASAVVSLPFSDEEVSLASDAECRRHTVTALLLRPQGTFRAAGKPSRTPPHSFLLPPAKKQNIATHRGQRSRAEAEALQEAVAIGLYL